MFWPEIQQHCSCRSLGPRQATQWIRFGEHGPDFSRKLLVFQYIAFMNPRKKVNAWKKLIPEMDAEMSVKRAQEQGATK